MKIPLLLLGLIFLSNTTLLNLNSAFNGGLIVNGDFSINSCPANHDWCLFTDRNSVPGWIPDPQI